VTPCEHALDANTHACLLLLLLLCTHTPTQALADAQATERLVANLRKRINGSMADMRVVFESFDAAGSGLLPYKAFQVACAALGVVLSPQEQAWVKARAAAGADAPAGCVKWGAFCEAFC
jgi:hypothetical protein